MVEVCEDDVIPILDAVWIESDRADIPCVRMGKAN